MFEKYTNVLKETIEQAVSVATSYSNKEVNTKHMYFAMLSNDNNVLPKIFDNLNIDKQDIRFLIKEEIDKLPKSSNLNKNDITISKDLSKALSKAETKSMENKDNYVSIYSYINANINDLNKYLTKENIKNIKDFLTNYSIENRVQSQSHDDSDSFLEKYGIDLTKKAINHELDPVIGRSAEVDRTIQILLRKTKNNPILLGEPGVGKTAVVEGIAQKIVNNEVPLSFANKKIISIEMSSLVAGTKYRGEFEDRIKNLIEEVKKRNDVILFIDEIHTIVGAGNSEGGMDVANILKPSLSRGELRIVGATTMKEYRKYFEKDMALQRRFQPIDVNEPSTSEALQILRGVKTSLENYHNINIEDEALVSAVKLSSRYITDRFLPDKAIDLIDEGASEVKIQIESEPRILTKVRRELDGYNIEKEALKMSKNSTKEAFKVLENKMETKKLELIDLENRFKQEKDIFSKISSTKKSIDELNKEAETEQRNNNYEKVAEIKYGKIPKKEQELKQVTKEWEILETQGTILRNSVDEHVIASIVSRWTKIPIEKMLEKEKNKILEIDKYLKKSVKGQDEAIEAISRVIKKNKAGLGDENRPIGSFLFLGTTGVGKTESAKALASFLFDDPKNMIRFDMSEYMEKHSVSKLIGSPAGYVGYEEGGILTELVRRKPYSVILFDEIEKAHHDIYNILLQILDEGRLSDNKGFNVDFTNTIIILTSNVGSELILNNVKKDGDFEEKLNNKLLQYFKAEFLNRLDEKIVFNKLTKDVAKEILELLLTNIVNKLIDKNINMKLDKDVKEYLIDIGFSDVYGARTLRRILDKEINSRLSELILEDKLNRGSNIKFILKNQKLDTVIS